MRINGARDFFKSLWNEDTIVSSELILKEVPQSESSRARIYKPRARCSNRVQGTYWSFRSTTTHQTCAEARAVSAAVYETITLARGHLHKCSGALMASMTTIVPQNTLPAPVFLLEFVRMLRKKADDAKSAFRVACRRLFSSSTSSTVGRTMLRNVVVVVQLVND